MAAFNSVVTRVGMLPAWYKFLALPWPFVAAFWWFATEFNGYSFWSIPTLAGPNAGDGWQLMLAFQLAVIAAMFAPLIMLPIDLLCPAKNRKNANAPNT